MGSTSYKTKSFMDDNFMLHNETAEQLFHEVAKPLPIIDYHNHIDPRHLSGNKQFDNIAELWVENDPYKHRAMRINGVPEDYITGSATPYEKFYHWAKTVPATLGNPLFHWSALEMKRVFGLEDILSVNNAIEVWDHCNTLLGNSGFGAADLVEKCNVEIIGTSDELLDNLAEHLIPEKRSSGFTVRPSLRCDTALIFDQNAPAYFAKVGGVTGVSVHTLGDFKQALLDRIAYFDNHGCRFADHALDAGFAFIKTTDQKADVIFSRLMKREHLSSEDVIKLRSHMLVFLGTEYSKRNWAMQLHIGAQRFTSSRLRSLAGPAGGYTCIGSSCDIASLCAFLDELEKNENLPRTILYTLNPVDNEAFASITGSFAEDNIPGKVQFGPAWWYNDHADGIRKQLTALANYGLLSRFIGMTTDSRSILSIYRHEYFRRIFCNHIGEWVESGELPDETEILTNLVRDVSYTNIKKWFTNE